MGIERFRLTRAAAVAASAISIVAGAPAVASAQAPPVVPGSRYLALGDSVTFGYKEPTVVPTPNYRDQSAFVGYPRMVGRELRVRVTNAACPGETSSSFINPAAVNVGCENILGKGVGYRTVFPLHVQYKGSQLAFALSFLRAHANVRLVSLMIGANDFFACSETPRCLSATGGQSVYARISRNVRTILSAIRNTAHYRGQLMIVNYYSFNYSLPAENRILESINNAQDSGARPFNVRIANGFAEWQVATFRFGGDSCAAGLLTQLGKPGDCGIHPSFAGQALLAKAVIQAARL